MNNSKLWAMNLNFLNGILNKIKEDIGIGIESILKLF